MDERVEKYLNDVIKKELEYDIDALKLKEDGTLIKAKGTIRIRRMALEEMYRRTFGESYVSPSKEASSDPRMRQ